MVITRRGLFGWVAGVASGLLIALGLKKKPDLVLFVDPEFTADHRYWLTDEDREQKDPVRHYPEAIGQKFVKGDYVGLTYGQVYKEPDPELAIGYSLDNASGNLLQDVQVVMFRQA